MAETTESKSKGISINLSPRAREVIEGIRDDTGVPNTEAMTRILEWFSSLDRKLRVAVLTKDEDTKKELMALVVREMAGMQAADQLIGGPTVSFRVAIEGARSLLDRAELLHSTLERELKPAKKKG